MTTTVIAYFPSPPQGVWHLGPVPIRAYALFIIIGIVAALLIGDRRWEARGGERGVIYDIALWAVPFGLIGGRLYHLATDWRTYFGEDGAGPIAALRIWDGGLGIWGAVALGGVGAWIACRRRGIPLPAFGDAIAPGIVLAQAIGRLGQLLQPRALRPRDHDAVGFGDLLPARPGRIRGCAFARRRVDRAACDGCAADLPLRIALEFIGIRGPDLRGSAFHDRAWSAVRDSMSRGYCVGRFCVELLRDDTATHIAGIRINSFTSTFVFIGAVVYLILAPKGREDPATLSGSAAESTGTGLG